MKRENFERAKEIIEEIKEVEDNIRKLEGADIEEDDTVTVSLSMEDTMHIYIHKDDVAELLSFLLAKNKNRILKLDEEVAEL